MTTPDYLARAVNAAAAHRGRRAMELNTGEAIHVLFVRHADGGKQYLVCGPYRSVRAGPGGELSAFDGLNSIRLAAPVEGGWRVRGADQSPAYDAVVFVGKKVPDQFKDAPRLPATGCG
jgi:hypothetical protein